MPLLGNSPTTCDENTLTHTEILLAVKIENIPQKNFDIFHILAQNIDCGYMLEPPEVVLHVTSTHNLCFAKSIKIIFFFFMNFSI